MKNVLLACCFTILIVGCSSKDVVSVVQDEQGQNVLMTDGNKVLKESMDKVFLYNESFIKVQKDNKLGMVSYAGEMVLEPKYESISPLYKGYAIIGLDGLYGIVDETMKVIVEPQFQQIKIEDNFFVVKKDTQTYCMNAKSEMIGESYDHIYYFVEGYARVEKNQKFGFINDTCEEVTAVTYDYVSDFINGYAKVKINDTISYLDDELNLISKEELKEGYFFQGK